MRKKCPWVPQIEAVECGAAALGSILAFHGKWMPLAELRQRCGVSRDGSRASRLIRAARELGCQARGFRCSMESLAAMTLPAILHWEGSHFVVLEKIERGGASFRIVDPAKGRRNITRQEFSTCFAGVVLVIEPNDDFKPAGRPPTTMGFLFGNWKSGRTLLALSFAATLGMISSGVLSVYVLTQWVDEVLATDYAPRLLRLNLGFAFAILLFFSCGVWRRFLLTRIGAEKIAEDSVSFLHHLLRLPLPLLQQRPPRDWASLLPLQAARGNLLQEPAATSLLEIPAIFVMGGMLFYYDSSLATAAVAAAASLTMFSWMGGRFLQPSSEKVEEAEERLESRSQLGLSLQAHFLCQGEEETFLKGRESLQGELLNQWRGHETRRAILAWGFRVLFGTSLSLLVFAGAWQVHFATHTPGRIAGFFLALLLFFLPVLAIIRTLPALRRFREIWRLRADILSMPTEIPPQDPPSAVPPDNQGLSLQRVSFSYSAYDSPTLQNISISLSRGRMIAVVGSSGSGKSTLAKIAAGVLRAQSGTRMIGECKTAWVDQDVHLFTGTLWENISLWDPHLSTEDAAHALQLAQLPLRGFANRWNTIFEDAGTSLSGGERQSIAIARVLARKPDILVLDESTSALDEKTQTCLLNSLKQTKIGILLCTHRLEAAKWADEIVVLQDSRIVQQGHFSSISTTPGPFSALFDLHLET